jgi:hypothetical protein
MKRIVSFLFLLSLLISACNVAAKQPEAANQPAPAVVLASPTIAPTFTQVPPLAPTSTLEIPSPTQAVQAVIVPTFTPLPPPQTLPSNIIAFDTGGTWKDTLDSVPSGGSKTYILNAMQGQVMSVSITGGYFPLQIQGRNGTMLCPVEANSECSFWRGTLPLSQDYFITVRSGGLETNFNLRVAINPPGKQEQFFTYTSGNVSLAYSDQFAPYRTLSTLNHKTPPQLSLQLIDTSSYANTNLGEAYFSLGYSADPQIVAACTQPNQSGGGMETPVNILSVNGYNFNYSTAADAGAGNIYNQHIYRVVNNGTCYEVIYFIHSSNIGNYPPGVVKEFDQAGLMNKFNKILTTLQLK